MADEDQTDLTGLAGELQLRSTQAGPKGTRTLRSRRQPLMDPAVQLARLDALDLPGGDFAARLRATGVQRFEPAAVEIFQINVGRLCNMACRHCHVDAGPTRVTENMGADGIDACLRAVARTGAHTVDITGGAPELNPHFRRLVQACVDRGLHVMDRCNLTVLLLPKFADLPTWLGERGVEIVASLPHHRERNTDAQRGDGTFARSIEALKRLNAAGYGKGDPSRRLTLMHNPAGAYLPSSQAGLEATYKASLARQHGVTFDRLIALNNMPIARYLEWLEASDNLAPYLRKLVSKFNPATVGGLMCRNTLSVSWDGTLYDCDFNQMLDLPIQLDGRPATVHDLAARGESAFANREIITRRHCFGCTAGAGSSCGGATA